MTTHDPLASDAPGPPDEPDTPVAPATAHEPATVAAIVSALAEAADPPTRTVDEEPDDDDDDAGPDPGRRRRRLALVVVGVALVSALGGAYVGSRLRSPADAEADRTPPTASRITVPVTREALSSTLTLSGEIQFAEPFPVRLAGSVGLGEGDTAVVTRLPEVDAAIAEGDALLDVSGRPVFAIVGDAPMYRSLEAGATGTDVLAVEQALDRLGFSPGTVDEVFDAGTEAALDQFYSSRGYSSVGPSDAETERLRELRQAITDSEESLNQAKSALADAGQRPKGAELLALQQAVQTARDALPRAEAAAQRNNDAAVQAVTAATTTRDAALTRRNAARTQLDAVKAAGAINPDTGEAYTAAEIAVYQTALADAETTLAAAELELTNAVANRDSVAAQGIADVTAATNAKVLAEAQLNDALKPPDTSVAQQAVDDAQEAYDRANLDYLAADASIGTKLPAGEILFVPSLPSNVTAVAAIVGAAPSGDLLTMSSSVTTVVGRVGRADAALVVEGARVTIDLRDYDLQFPGIVSYVGQPPSTGSGDGSDGSGGGGDSGSGRLQVTVTPDDPTAVADYVFSSVRILIEVASTEDDVLVVPVAAVSVGGDGTSRVEVERAPVTDDDPGSTEVVIVDVGLSAQGLVEITPVGDASLVEGDRVVVGIQDDSGSTGDTGSGGDGAGG